MTVHTPTFHMLTKNHAPAWYWECTCGVTQPEFAISFSKTVARLNYYQQHEFPDLTPPDHTVTTSRDELGVWMWVCTCEAASHPRGHREESRARQSHTRHHQTALLDWYQKQHEHLFRVAMRSRDDNSRFARLSPEGKILYAEKYLEELL